ncbi:hypothetical protein PRIPAC_96455 [Pristionchus pacificus]|uniref:Cytochrome P450 n=1 Tax=Pristionchus pacificus TaxID=54126 RepID=A0A2A6BJ16_PRIPA|nr:hypothetical protein PRIPAC_96455 [Pristionchus pacificus]|eukprot:PDM65843.1 cytochrome P450 [Pristionchus pacificus]
MIYLVIIGLVLLGLLYEMYWKRKDLPPGPTPLPLIGNLIPIIWNFPGLDVMHKWRKEYGPIYTYWMGPLPIVTVNEMNLVQQMFVQDGDNYADRAAFGNLTEKYRGGNFGIVESSGQTWREQRRFALHTLRDFGLGKEEMQEQILLEADSLLTELEKECKETGEAWPIKHTEKTVASVINLTLFGYRFDKNCENEFYRVRKMLDAQNEELRNPIIIAFIWMPQWLSDKIPWVKRRFDLMWKVRDELFKFFGEKIQEHRDAIDYTSEECNDFCDAYLKEMHRLKDDPDTSFHEKQFINVCLDLWLAGMETTASTMAWGTALLLNYPEIQQKLHDEFDRVIGSDRLITMKDKNELHFLNAFINEVQRWANIVPQNLLRKMGRDVDIAGVHLKAGTAICPQISMLMSEESVFPDPYSFRPDRFIDEAGKLKTFKQFLPFSIGKRQCPGEGLARMELYLFFANLVHRFNITPIDSSKIPSLKKTLTTASKPEAFPCKLERRTVQKTY